MIIIETNYDSFDHYLLKLSKPARKNCRAAMLRNVDLVYRRTDFSRVREFMELWTKQLVRGKHPEWAFPVETVENWYLQKELMVFETDISLHFIQKRNGYWDCHPPLFDKKYNGRYLAKFMWFNLIKYAIENKLGPLNMGGGIDTSWREMIKRRAEFPNPAYKFIYVPQKAKMFPDEERDYKIINHTLI